MSEPIKIEPHYQAQAKQLVDCLFDKGFFSESLSRDGMDGIEGLVALYLQLGAQSAARCAELAKKYKATSKGRQEGEDQPRHEEEMRWIARAREAEARVRELERFDPKGKAEEAWKWGREVGYFLKNILSSGWGADMGEASRLFTDAIALGITPEPDVEAARLKARDAIFGEGGCACPPEKKTLICPKCGGRKI